MERALEHQSGCSWDMVAMYKKGKRRVIGTNRLTDPAILHSPHFADSDCLLGRHCELNVMEKCQRMGIDLNGGTLYVVGVIARNGNEMENTGPCHRCRRWLPDTGIRHLVFFKDGELVKEAA